jgi:hypothetical protein
MPDGTNRFTVNLWANDDVFTKYYDWATPTGASSTTFERNAANTYSGYVLRFSCNISDALTANGSGCCLQDDSGQSGDGYCLLQYNDPLTSVKSAQTYYITNSQFNVCLADPYDISSGLMVPTNDSNLSGFQRFQCETFTADTGFVCDKFELWPAATYNGGFRFEKGNMAKGYFYDAGQTGYARWTMNIMMLQSAMNSFVYSSISALLAIAFLF